MLFVEWVVLFIIGVFAVNVGYFVHNESKRAHVRAEKKEQRRLAALNALREALETHDYRRLDDFLVLWGDALDADAKRQVFQRRNDLFVEDNFEFNSTQMKYESRKENR